MFDSEFTIIQFKFYKEIIPDSDEEDEEGSGGEEEEDDEDSEPEYDVFEDGR